MAYGGDLQANTAVDVIIGPFVDETNGKDAETGLTITQAEVRLSKNGGNMAQKNEATSLTHDELGNYVCKLNTTDTNAEGLLTLMIHESGALPIKMDYTVLCQAAYISKYTAKDTGFMGVDIAAISADTTAADNLELFTEVLENGTGLIDAGTFKAGAIDASAIANAAIDNATFAADVGSTAHGTNIIALAVRKILEELNLDHLLKVDTTVAADGDLEDYVVAGTVMAHVMSANKDVTGFKCTTDSLEAQKVHADTIKAETTLIVEDTGTTLENRQVTIAVDVAGLDGDGMVGTDNAALASVLGAAVGASISADIAAVKTVADAVQVVTDNLAASATTIVSGTVSWDNSNATTVNLWSDDITTAAADHYNGRIIIFTSGTLQNQATDITDYVVDAGEGKFTFTALTSAPADNVTFVIV